MKDNTKVMVLIAAMVKNIAAIAVFSYLAVYFNHWWISLFSLLFMTTYNYSSDKKGDDKK